MQSYCAVITVPITVGGTKCRTNVKSIDYQTAEQARDYAELFLEVGIAIAYQVIVKTGSGNTYFLEYARLLTTEEQNSIPILPDPYLETQEERQAPKTNPIQDPIFPRNVKGGPARISDASRHIWDKNWPKPPKD